MCQVMLQIRVALSYKYFGGLTFDGRGGATTLSLSGAVPFNGRGAVTAISLDSVMAFHGGGRVAAFPFNRAVTVNAR